MANSTHHTGRLAADPKLRTVDDLQVCNMRLAVQRRRGRGGEDRGAFFIDVVAFNGLAGICDKYLHKGSRIQLDGHLDIQEWTGQDDVRRWTPKIIAEQIEFLDPAPASTPADTGVEQEPADELAERRAQHEEQDAAVPVAA